LKIWVLICSVLEHCTPIMIGFKMTICNSFWRLRLLLADFWQKHG